jgi:hypothetical protein
MKSLTVNGKIIEANINAQLVYWRQQRENLEGEVRARRTGEPFITISREYGAGGYDVAVLLANAINDRFRHKPEWVAYDRKILEMVTEDMGLSSRLMETLTSSVRNEITNLFQTTFSKFPPQVAVYRRLAETVRALAMHGHVVIVGRGSVAITRGMENGFHVRFVASLEWKAARIAAKCEIRKKDAEKMIKVKGRQRDDFFRKFVKFDLDDPKNYHITVNMAEFSIDDTVNLVLEGMRLKGML